MRIPNPRECACDTDGDCDVRNNPHYENCVVVVLVVDEDKDHPEDKPHET